MAITVILSNGKRQQKRPKNETQCHVILYLYLLEMLDTRNHCIDVPKKIKKGFDYKLFSLF